jgi:hypothetical protein
MSMKQALSSTFTGTQNPSQTNNVGLRGLEVGTIFLRDEAGGLS